MNSRIEDDVRLAGNDPGMLDREGGPDNREDTGLFSVAVRGLNGSGGDDVKPAGEGDVGRGLEKSPCTIVEVAVRDRTGTFAKGIPLPSESHQLGSPAKARISAGISASVVPNGFPLNPAGLTRRISSPSVPAPGSLGTFADVVNVVAEQAGVPLTIVETPQVTVNVFATKT